MVTLLSSAKLVNLKKSVEVYLAESLAGTGLAVDWEGAPAHLAEAPEWLQPRLLTAGRQFHRQVAWDAWGESFYSLISLNIFVRPSSEVSAARLYELRDLMAGLLYPGTIISFQDFDLNPAQTIGSIKVDQVVDDRTVPSRPAEPLQYNFTVRIAFLARWSV